MESRSPFRRLVKITIVSVALVFEVGLLYILSYALFLRAKYGADHKPDPPDMLVQYDFSEDDFIGSHTAFAPVEWLIDKKILARPLTAWARICGVAHQQAWRALCRLEDGWDWPATWSEAAERSRARKRMRSGGKTATTSGSRRS